MCPAHLSSAAGLLPVQQRHDSAKSGVHPGQGVAKRDVGAHRGAVLIPVDVAETSKCLYNGSSTSRSNVSTEPAVEARGIRCPVLLPKGSQGFSLALPHTHLTHGCVARLLGLGAGLAVPRDARVDQLRLKAASSVENGRCMPLKQTRLTG